MDDAESRPEFLVPFWVHTYALVDATSELKYPINIPIVDVIVFVRESICASIDVLVWATIVSRVPFTPRFRF